MFTALCDCAIIARSVQQTAATALTKVALTASVTCLSLCNESSYWHVSSAKCNLLLKVIEPNRCSSCMHSICCTNNWGYRLCVGVTVHCLVHGLVKLCRGQWLLTFVKAYFHAVGRWSFHGNRW